MRSEVNGRKSGRLSRSGPGQRYSPANGQSINRSVNTSVNCSVSLGPVAAWHRRGGWAPSSGKLHSSVDLARQGGRRCSMPQASVARLVHLLQGFRIAACGAWLLLPLLLRAYAVSAALLWGWRLADGRRLASSRNPVEDQQPAGQCGKRSRCVMHEQKYLACLSLLASSRQCARVHGHP